jgi:major inositol transporter-like SP family MFS transporter
MVNKNIITQKKNPNKKMLFIVFVATIGEFLFGYDTGVISGAIFTMNTDFDIKNGSAISSFITASLIIGAVLGSFFAGRIADKLGRRRNIMILAFVFFFGTLFTSLSPNVWCVILARIVLGFAVGGASATVPVYISEMSSTKNRGRMVAIDQMMIVIGQLVAYIANSVIENITHNAPGTWRYMIVLGTLPAILLWVGMLILPDTPRWYIANKLPEKAKKLLLEIRDAAEVKTEMLDIEKRVKESKNIKAASIKDFKTPWIKRLLLIGIIIAITQQITGVDTIMYYAPVILKNTGLSTSAAIFCTIANGIISVIASIYGIWQVGRRARRKMILTGQIGILTTLALIGVTFMLFIKQEGLDANGDPIIQAKFSAVSFIVLGLMLVFLIFQQGYVSPVTWLMLSEMFPTRIRGLYMGLSTAILWAAKFFVVFAFPILLASIGGAPTFIMFAAINVIVACFVYVNVPEMKDVSLERLEREFEEKGTKIHELKQEMRTEKDTARINALKLQVRAEKDALKHLA